VAANKTEEPDHDKHTKVTSNNPTQCPNGDIGDIGDIGDKCPQITEKPTEEKLDISTLHNLHYHYENENNYHY